MDSDDFVLPFIQLWYLFPFR